MWGRYQLLLNNLRGATNRAAHFTSAIACIFPNGDTIEAEGICPGTIAFAPQGMAASVTTRYFSSPSCARPMPS